MTQTASPSPTPAGPKAERGLLADLAGLRHLWPYLKQDRRLVIVAILLIPVISLLQSALPLLLKGIIDRGILGKDLNVLAIGAGLYLGAVVLEYCSRAGQSVASSIAVHRMIRGLRTKLVGNVMGLKASYHDRSLSGALVTRATGDFDNLSESLNMGVLTSFVDMAVLVGCVIGMFVLDWRLACTALIILPIVGWIVQWFSKGLKSAMLKARVKISALNAYTQECLYGNATIKLLTGEDAADKRYDRLNIEYRDAQMGSVVLDAWMFSVLDGIASITVGIILWLSVTRAGIASTVSAGVLVAFVQYVQQLFEPLKQLGNKMAMLQGAFTSIERIFGVLALHERVTGDITAPPIAGRVAFEHVNFAYDTGREAGKAERILRDVSFTLEPGESLAIVGPTGSGKSTIVKLLTKLYDGYEGRILIDGQDLAQLEPVSLRQQLAIVPQDIVLFDGTVAFNISLDLPGVTPADIEGAAKQVGAHDFIMRLPGGYEHEIKERGANLSHGQRQLIAFARALARRPGLVVLDEATSSVDPESEAAIQKATLKILKGRSVVVIAHRLSTIRQCDKILVIEKGRVVEGGKHDELLAKRAAYFQLHEAFA